MDAWRLEMIGLRGDRAHARGTAWRHSACALLWIAAAFAATGAAAADPIPQCTPTVAKVASAQGNVEIRRAGQPQWLRASLSDALCAGDIVRVGERSRAAIAMINDIEVRLDEKTTLTLAKVDASEPSLLEMCSGAMHFISRFRSTFRVITPFVNAAVEGTEAAIAHSATQDRIDVFEGRVLASSEASRSLPQSCGDVRAPADGGGRLLLASRESALVTPGSAPVLRAGAVARADDAVQWALYYPPIVDPGTQLATGGTAESRARQSIARYREGAFGDALSAIMPLENDVDVRDPRFFAYRASLLLWVGRVDEAGRDIERAIALDPRNADAPALRALVSVVQNRKNEALDAANRAVALNEQSATARIALSYALQAHFRIAEALDAANESARLEPTNALAWARVAELEMSSGRLDRALTAARRALEANPHLGRAQVILGFAHLARFETAEAKNAFERAIESDQADPMPRLGLGLAKIRQNALDEGRNEIEIAVSLDPANSLLRSYLGKAYFEERRDTLAAREYDMAKERDPADPSPWFYGAIEKQTQNRPVEALQDLQKSIDLNDNRAPYRSRLLLDEDLAARAVSLAWIFDDLGLDQVAKLEAAKAQAADPTSSAGHQFLADAFGRQRRQEITRVSEILQAQLLQPAILATIAPESTFRSLPFLAGDSPVRASFGEYTALFDRDRPSARLSAAGGNLDTLSDVASASMRSGPWSLGAGQFYYHTDGFRPNNDITHRIYNAMAQLTVVPGLDVQMEFRHRDSENGDLGSYGSPDTFDPGLRQEVKHDIARVGVHASTSPESHWLFSYLHGKRTEEVLVPLFDLGDLNVTGTDEGDQTELLYVYRTPSLSLLSGVGTYGFDARRANSFGSEPCPVESCELDQRARRENAYAYATLRLPYRTQMIVGLSYDRLKDANLEVNKLGPKFGVVTEPTDWLTVRAAAFRSVKPALIANQTLEPTHIFGFSQYADDANGSVSDRYGIAADVRLPASVYAGAEATWRRIRFPLNAVDVPFFLEPRERTAEAYVGWMPATWAALSARYSFEQWQVPDDDAASFGLPGRISTQVAPLSARLFLGSGWSIRATTNLVQQRIDVPGADGVESERSRFAITDLAIAYRLAQRRGELSLEIRNLFDRSFSWRDTNFLSVEPLTPRFVPTRTVIGRISLYF